MAYQVADAGGGISDGIVFPKVIENTTNYSSEYLLNLIVETAYKYGVPPEVALRVAGMETTGNPNTIRLNSTLKSPAGALGIYQIMPGTAKGLGVDPTDPIQSIDGGIRYLKQQYDNFGSWPLALAGYNAGPGAVQQYKGIPPYGETQNYVRSILGGNVNTTPAAVASRDITGNISRSGGSATDSYRSYVPPGGRLKIQEHKEYMTPGTESRAARPLVKSQAPYGYVPLRETIERIYGYGPNSVHWDETTNTIRLIDPATGREGSVSKDAYVIVDNKAFIDPSYIRSWMQKPSERLRERQIAARGLDKLLAQQEPKRQEEEGWRQAFAQTLSRLFGRSAADANK